jgi:TPR repeat protein
MEDAMEANRLARAEARATGESLLWDGLDLIVACPLVDEEEFFFELSSFANKWSFLVKATKFFERAATKGNADAQWICDILTTYERPYDETRLVRLFKESNDPRGLFIAAHLMRLMFGTEEERSELLEICVARDLFWAFPHVREGKDESLLLKGAERGCRNAWCQLGRLRDEEKRKSEAKICFLKSAELGLKGAQNGYLARCYFGKNWKTAVQWGPLCGEKVYFWTILGECAKMFADENFRCAAIQNRYEMAYEIGRAVYWNTLKKVPDHLPGRRAFAEQCLYFYIRNVENTKKSILLFLLFWKKHWGVKDVAIKIGKMVWEEDCRGLNQSLFGGSVSLRDEREEEEEDWGA